MQDQIFATTLGKNLMIHVYNFERPFFAMLSYFLYAITQQQYHNVLFNDIFQLL